jgi:selenocysteine lyase/cysteine desulfurase
MYELTNITQNDPTLDLYFDKFRKKIIGYDTYFDSPYGRKRIYYSDWTASGRLYKDIEDKLNYEIAQYIGNTHTESNLTGTLMTNAYHAAQKYIKKHVNATKDDVILLNGSGMTGALAKLMRIMGFQVPVKLRNCLKIDELEKPVVFITHMEHHSNQTQWEESLVEVVILKHDGTGLVDLNDLEQQVKKYNDRKWKIASVTACSNVTGIETPIYEIAKIMHKNGGKCFVDFACSAPHVKIDMHKSEEEKLDAIYFSPHKFVGGPGTPGVVIFCATLYDNAVPDIAGGGTVEWTNPWGEHKFYDDIELREDAGTPAFLGTIKTALVLKLKEEMGYEETTKREHLINKKVFQRLSKIPNLHLLADIHEERICVYSFYIDELHYNLGVKILSDKYGIQVRGGCSCAGTYGHYLLHVDQYTSKQITDKISCGDYSEKPGWIRMSLHPINSDEEIDYMLNSIEELAKNHKVYALDYNYFPKSNTFQHKKHNNFEDNKVKEWLF